MKHCFDYYTVRVRRRQHKQMYEQLRSLGESKSDLFMVVSDFFNSLSNFRDHSEQKTLAIKDGAPSADEKQSLLYGFFKSGPYGTSHEIVNRKTKKKTAMSEDDAHIYKFFYCFYLPENSSTGALIMHKVGVHGVFSMLEHQLNTYFSDTVEDCILEIQPVHFNLTKARKATFTKLEFILSKKKTALQKHGSRDVSPYRRTLGRCIVELGHDAGFVKQLFDSEEPDKFALSKAKPFFGIKTKNYDVTVNAKVKMDGLNKTIKIQKQFQYNTSVDKTDALKFTDGYPTEESLLKEARASIAVLKQNGEI